MRFHLTFDDPGFQLALGRARAVSATRLFALSPDGTNMQWHYRPDEKAMRNFLDSRKTSDKILFSSSIAVLVVDPRDSDEKIRQVIDARHRRMSDGPGYFSEAF
jgi:hypothetical protein